MTLPILHMTAAWTNAALVALLPQFSDCAKKLNLPIPTPITISQVQRFVPPTLADQFEAAMWLTNGYLFHYFNGIVYFTTRDDWFVQQDIEGLERFAGKDNMTTNDAIDLARNSFMKLGHKLAEGNMTEPPTDFEPAGDSKRLGHIPWCLLRWHSPKTGIVRGSNFYWLEFHIDLQQKRLAGMVIIGGKFWRPIPKLDVTPELEADYQKRIQRTNAP